MHLKNFSLIETSPGNSEYVWSPAYDLLPVNLVMPEDKEQMALTINGKKRNIRKKDFYVFAENCGINRKSAEKMTGKVVSLENKFIEMTENSFLPDDMKRDFTELIKFRMSNLK